MFSLGMDRVAGENDNFSLGENDRFTFGENNNFAFSENIIIIIIFVTN